MYNNIKKLLMCYANVAVSLNCKRSVLFLFFIWLRIKNICDHPIYLLILF